MFLMSVTIAEFVSVVNELCFKNSTDDIDLNIKMKKYVIPNIE